MSQKLTVHLERPIGSVRILDDSPSTSGESKKCDAGQTPVQDLQADKTGFSKACQALNGVVAKLNQLYDTLFAGHREEITKLSVEIARKILMQKMQNGDYEIESIVQEALKNAPTHEDVVVHLNPEDLAGLQKVQQDDASSFVGIKFVADPNIGRAECRLESPKGIIESSINEHLERIGKALTDSQKQ